MRMQMMCHCGQEEKRQCAQTMRAQALWISVEVVVGVRIMQCHANIDVVIGVRVMLCHQSVDNSGFSTSSPNSHLVFNLYHFILTFQCSHFVHTFAPRKRVI